MIRFLSKFAKDVRDSIVVVYSICLSAVDTGSSSSAGVQEAAAKTTKAAAKPDIGTLEDALDKTKSVSRPKPKPNAMLVH